MFNVRLADINFCIDNKYPYVENLCGGYKTSAQAEVLISVSDGETDAENESGAYSKGYCESLAVYRKISETLLLYDGFLMHSAVISSDGRGIAFAARSGVGKTTHIRLWQENFDCAVVNGDKPLIRFINGEPRAYGTPWSGKEGLNSNTSVRLYDIVFITRSKENYIKRIEASEAVKRLFLQIYMPPNAELRLKTTALMDRLLKQTRVWEAGCKMDLSAAATVRGAIFDQDKRRDGI